MDYDLRHKILEKRAVEACTETRGLSISEIVLAFLAERLTESGRELEGAVHRLRASFQLTDQPVTIETAEQIARAMAQLVLYGRRDDYFDTFTSKASAVPVDCARREKWSARRRSGWASWRRRWRTTTAMRT